MTPEFLIARSRTSLSKSMGHLGGQKSWSIALVSVRPKKIRHFVSMLIALLNLMTSKAQPFGHSEGTTSNEWHHSYSTSDERIFPTQEYATSKPSETRLDWNDPDDRTNRWKIPGPDSIWTKVSSDFDETRDLTDEDQHDRPSMYLLQLRPRVSWAGPLIVLLAEPSSSDPPEVDSEWFDESELRSGRSKKSRYYHRHPYRNQNYRYRSSYDYNPIYYVCMPNRKDVSKLLRALHDLRQGDRSRHIHVCNLHRTARNLLTHVRFLGRKK